jgi:hypothetical protein
MLERHLQQKVLTIAKLYGWLVFHPLPAQNSNGQWRTATQGDTGWPDLALAHPTHGFILVELKRGRGQLTDNQKRWRDVLLAAGVEYHVWRPEDLDAIHDRLRGIEEAM